MFEGSEIGHVGGLGGPGGPGDPYKMGQSVNKVHDPPNVLTGYLKAVWPEICGSVFGPCSAKLGPKTPLERRGSSCSAGCTKNQPGRPMLRPLRDAKKFWPDCLQVPRICPSTKNWVPEGSLAGFLLGSVLGVWAAPGGFKTIKKCGGLRPPHFWMV